MQIAAASTESILTWWKNSVRGQDIPIKQYYASHKLNILFLPC